MFTIDVRANFEQFRRDMDDLAKRKANSVMAVALNETAVIAKDAVVAEMRQVFDRPTPWTLNSMRIKRAGPRNLVARIYFREEGGAAPAAKYLFPQIFGGKRSTKRFERALQAIGVLPQGWIVVPGKRAQLDAYGNIKQGQIVQILSYFGALEKSGYKANMTEKGKKRLARSTKKRRGFSYFAISPGAKSHLRPGIYQKFGFAWGSAIHPVMIFASKAHYRPLLKFNQIVDRVAKRELERQFHAAYANS